MKKSTQKENKGSKYKKLYRYDSYTEFLSSNLKANLAEI